MFRAHYFLLLLLILLPGCSLLARPTPIPPPAQSVPPTVVPAERDFLLVIGPASEEITRAMEELLLRFEQEEGIAAEYRGAAQVALLLRETVEAGESPDVVLLPVPTWLREMAAADVIPPLSAENAAAVREHFGPAWVELVSYEGELYGVPFDANTKSLLWYRPELLEGIDGRAPATLEELFDLAARLEEQGQPAFAVPGQPGWPLTDWFENVLLAHAGADLYDDLATHRIPWTDPAVEEAASLYASLLRDGWVMGGAEGAVSLPLRTESFNEVFDARKPGAVFWLGQSTIIRNFLAGSELRAEDISLMPFHGDGTLMGSGSVAVATNEQASSAALLAYLTRPAAVEGAVRRGGFISPNRALSLDLYPDALARQEAELIVGAERFRYDLSDRLPPHLKSHLEAQLAALLLHPEQVEEILVEIERVATREQGSPAGVP